CRVTRVSVSRVGSTWVFHQTGAILREKVYGHDQITLSLLVWRIVADSRTRSRPSGPLLEHDASPNSECGCRRWVGFRLFRRVPSPVEPGRPRTPHRLPHVSHFL